MGALLGAGILVMIAAETAVGARLMLLARHTRGLPELLIGASLLLFGGIGYPLAVLARNGAGGPEGGPDFLAAALAFQNLGCACIAFATWRTFRPAAAGARLACLAVTALMALGWAGQLLEGFSLQPGASPWYWLGFSGRLLPFLWTAAESWRCHDRLRRRLALGLGDPVVADRFRLWAVGAAGVSAGFLLFAVAAGAGVDVASEAWVLLATSFVAVVTGIAFWLAFLPPRAYLRRFEPARAATA